MRVNADVVLEEIKVCAGLYISDANFTLAIGDFIWNLFSTPHFMQLQITFTLL